MELCIGFVLKSQPEPTHANPNEPNKQSTELFSFGCRKTKSFSIEEMPWSLVALPGIEPGFRG
jgi:hypothetical protein